MINDMNEDFLIRLNYVETSEPDRVAKELQQQDHRIAELEKENFELQIELGITESNLDLEVEAKQRLLEIKEELEQKLEDMKNEANKN